MLLCVSIDEPEFCSAVRAACMLIDNFLNDLILPIFAMNPVRDSWSTAYGDA